MNLLDLMIKIGVDDKASSEIGGVTAKAKSNASKAAGFIKGVAKTALITAATTAVAVGKMSFDAFADYEQLVGGVETLFKQSAGKLQEYAAVAYKTAGLSANDYMEQATSFSASLIQSLEGDTEAAVEYANMAIIDMSDNANKMGTDIEMIQNAYQGFAKQNFTMLDNLKLGYGGTQSEMQRLIDDANRVKEANGEMADLSIDSFADIVEAINIIQTEMGITGTTAEEAAGTVSGSIASMKASWENFLTAVADPELDTDAAAQELIDSMQTVVDNAAPVIAEIMQSAWDLLGESLGNIFSEDTQAAWNNFIESFSAFEPLLEPILEAFQNIGDTIMWLLEPVLNLVIGIGTLFVAAIAGFLDAAHKLDTWLQTAPSEFMNFVDQANTWIGSLPGKFAAWFNGILSAAGSWIMGMVNKGNAAIQGFLNAIKNKWGNVASWFGGMGGRIKSAIGDLGSTLLSAGKSVLQGFWDGLKDKWNSVKSWFGDITAQIKDLKGPEDVDAKLLINNGKLVMQGFQKGLAEGWNNVSDYLGDITEEIPTTFGATASYSITPEATSSQQILVLIAELLASIDKSMPDSIDLDGREFGRLVRKFA